LEREAVLVYLSIPQFEFLPMFLGFAGAAFLILYFAWTFASKRKQIFPNRFKLLLHAMCT